ncbi:hypothetical protein SNE35_17950 [Paucibacter sp. R3-3]|uniref:Uncharacterized protein n=1 Tax=Roseateles agri TaxID=3098619 RepID=A0ABU5DKY6_9BURK|nr:hypothetical protein [Paucibacter sp. R3-3]MDY0746401.1 hypothetical protein [Paucibacter sp. R3-3]
MKADTNIAADRLMRLVDELLHHDDAGDLRVEVRILKRGQKEILLSCGKQYRYVVDFEPGRPAHSLTRSKESHCP